MDIYIWDGMWLGVDLKKRTKINMYLEEIGLRAQNILTILGSLVNNIGRAGLYDYSMSTWIFSLIIQGIYMSYDNDEANGYMHDLDLLILLH